MILRLPDAAARVHRSIRTLKRWAAAGQLRILPGGFVVERELLEAEASIRRRHLLRKYKEES